MRLKLSIFCSIFYLLYTPIICYGQPLIADSCGLDSSPILNKYEISFVDSLIFHPFSTKKPGIIDPKQGFDFRDKKIGFYSCTMNSNTKGKGVISKQKFFDLVRPTPKGHAGFGLIKFNETEKKDSNGFDAVIIIDCPYGFINNKDLISKLVSKNE